jgi:lipopolysaccharide transport protein LptA
MVNYRSIIIISLFSALVASVSIFAFFLELKSEDVLDEIESEVIEESHFAKMSYYYLQDMKPKMSFECKQLNIYGEVDISFIDPIGEFISQDGNKLEFQSQRGIYSKINETLSLKGDVILKEKDSIYQSQSLFYQALKKQIDADGLVSVALKDPKTLDLIKLNSDKLLAQPYSKYSLFTGNVNGSIERARKFEGKLYLKAAQVEAKLSESKVGIEGDVWIKRNNIEVKAGRGEIFLENFNKTLKYFAFYDDIKLVEQTPKFKRRAWAETIEGVTSQNKIVLSGAPRVEQGRDVIRGYRITLRENAELIEVEDTQSVFELKDENKKKKGN